MGLLVVDIILSQPWHKSNLVYQVDFYNFKEGIYLAVSIIFKLSLIDRPRNLGHYNHEP